MKTEIKTFSKTRTVIILVSILLFLSCKEDSSLPTEIAKFTYNRCTINYAEIVANTHTDYSTSTGISSPSDGTHSLTI